MLISPDSQGEGSGQQLSPDKASLLPSSVRAQPTSLALHRHLHGHAGDRVLSGRNLVGRLCPRRLFSFHPFPYPCTSSRVDHGDLELGVGECSPFTTEMWESGALLKEISLEVPWEQN